MPKQIIWSPLSEKDFAKILEYLDNEWDDKVSNQFIDLVDEFLEQISINPRQYPLIHKKKKIRKCVITMHNTLFYRDSKKQVDILRIYDTRQDPEKLKFK
jgi:plasmid stabilization system protein ParE